MVESTFEREKEVQYIPKSTCYSYIRILSGKKKKQTQNITNKKKHLLQKFVISHYNNYSQI